MELEEHRQDCKTKKPRAESKGTGKHSDGRKTADPLTKSVKVLTEINRDWLTNEAQVHTEEGREMDKNRKLKVQ